MHNYYFPPAPSSTPWAPAWSPDGRWIAVAMSGSIWKVDPASGVAQELTYDAKYHSMPDWSPDGNWIIYTADDGGTTIQLAIVNVATGETRALTNDKFIYTDPVFSPDGTRVAYVSTKPNGFFNVYIRPIKDGQWAGDEIAVSQRHQISQLAAVFRRGGSAHHARVDRATASSCCSCRTAALPLGSGNIWLAPAVAGGMDDARSRGRRADALSCAAGRVALMANDSSTHRRAGAADQFSNLYVQPVAGGEPYKLTFFEHDAFHPRWSPDGEWIAYIDNREGLPQLALLEVYGGDNRIVRIVDRRWKRPMGVLSVRTVDDRGQAHRRTNPSHGRRRQVLCACRRLRARQRGGRQDISFDRRVSCRAAGRQGRLTAVKGFEVSARRPSSSTSRRTK